LSTRLNRFVSLVPATQFSGQRYWATTNLSNWNAGFAKEIGFLAEIRGPVGIAGNNKIVEILTLAWVRL
jgi:hypothetical protein